MRFDFAFRNLSKKIDLYNSVPAQRKKPMLQLRKGPGVKRDLICEIGPFF